MRARWRRVGVLVSQVVPVVARTSWRIWMRSKERLMH